MKRSLLILLLTGLLVGILEGSASAASWPTLSWRTRGLDVMALQNLLQNRGFDLAVSGVFDANTLNAVKTFQGRYGLTAGGEVGPQTWSSLVESLRLGSTGPAVSALQRELNGKRGHHLAVDGVMGPLTTAAVKEFQRHMGLQADGVVNWNTWFRLIGHYQSIGSDTGPGWYHYGNDGYDAYGTANVIAQLKKVAADWRGIGYTVRLGIGDISRPHGEYFPPHRTHRDGLAADLSCVRNDGKEGACNWRDATYSRVLTQKLVSMLWETNQVQRILFNDPNMAGVTRVEGHDDHLHVEWKR